MTVVYKIGCALYYPDEPVKACEIEFSTKPTIDQICAQVLNTQKGKCLFPSGISADDLSVFKINENCRSAADYNSELPLASIPSAIWTKIEELHEGVIFAVCASAVEPGQSIK